MHIFMRYPHKKHETNAGKSSEILISETITSICKSGSVMCLPSKEYICW
jgi:hypothetical protein